MRLKKLFTFVFFLIIYLFLITFLINDKEWEYYSGVRYGDYVETSYKDNSINLIGTIRKDNKYVGNLVFYGGGFIVFFNLKKLKFSLYIKAET